MNLIQAVILGIIEGLTEFLPVSSTGHLILSSAMMNIRDEEFVKTFEIAIQLGAILSVLTLYFRRFLVGIDIYLKLAVAFIPTGIIGLLAYKTIKSLLFNPVTVSVALILGGVVLILLDRWTEQRESRYAAIEDIGYLAAMKIGLFQCISMIPGVSRAAATIFGGIFTGFDRRQAAEFSFLLAIPTMFAATGYDLMKAHAALDGQQLQLLLAGGAVAFVTALVAVKAFIAFLTRYGFKHFGWYRILIGVLFLMYYYKTGLTF